MRLNREHMATLSTAKNYDEAVAIAKKLDIDTDERFTAEINAYFESRKSGQLSDSDLDGISGGENWGNGHGNGAVESESSVVFAFNIGDEVETYHWGHTQRGIITGRTVAWSTGFNKKYYPYYNVETFNSVWSDWYRQDDISY